MKIGVFSGSFDPIHQGHVMLAREILKTGIVDRIHLIVSRINPLKEGKIIPASEDDRLMMASLAVADMDNIIVDNTELLLPSPSYSYRTLCSLREKYPYTELKLIVGADNIPIFNRWRNYRQILSEFGIIVYPRPGYESISLPPGAQWTDCTVVNPASSTEIRDIISSGGIPNESLLHPDVAQYIMSNKLYR